MNRRGFLASSATLAATSGIAGAPEVPGGTHRVERRAEFDERRFAEIVGRPAAIRQLYEAVAFAPAVLGSIKNSFNGLQFGFGFPPGQIAIALAGHGPSSAYAYGDRIWGTYRIGEFLKIDDAAGRPMTSNAFVAPHAPFDVAANPDDDAGMYQDASIGMLQRRGLIVLTCHTAVEEQSRAIVEKGFAPAGASAGDVAADILTHLIPGAVVVPSMVATIAVLQSRYHYTYLTPF
jgi:hypothetical protein